MINHTPLISIVIPTRNRAHLLQHALASALNQDFDDYEIVVIANACKDNTKELVHSMKNERVRYVETEKDLTMPDNWEFGWSQAKGEYVTFLADDDAFVPSALRTLAEKTLEGKPQVVSWEDAIFYSPDWHDARLQNLLLLFNFGDKEVEDVNPSAYLKALADFSFSWTAPIPKILNCLAHKATFDKWREQLGRLFYPSTPDYSFGWIATQVCPTIRVLHRPLTVRTISDHSVGSNGGLGESGKEHFSGFGEINFFADTPYKQPLLFNYIADCYMRVNKDFERLGMPAQALDWDKYCIAMATQLNESRELLPHWDKHLASFMAQTKEAFPQFLAQVETILATAPPAPDSNAESLRDMHQRTALMATESAKTFLDIKEQHLGDKNCAGCALALKKEIFAAANWSHVFLFGEKINASDPYALSLKVDYYYDLMISCKRKQELALKRISQRNRFQRFFASIKRNLELKFAS